MVVNGSFDTDLSGWTISSGDYVYWSDYPDSGHAVINPQNGGYTAYIKQSVDGTEVNKLTFKLRRNADASGYSIEIKFDGEVLDTITSVPSSSWVTKEYTGIESLNESAEFKVTVTSGDSVNIYLDDVVTSAAPTAAFSGTPLKTSSTSLIVTFTDESTGSPTSWAWTFGDTGTSALQNPTHTYSSPGGYTVSLEATNSTGSDTETKTAYVKVGVPVASFSYTKQGCTVTFNDESTANPTAYSWNFGDSGTSSSENIEHEYANPGTYLVLHTATNASGESDPCYTYVSVTPDPPVITVSDGGETPVTEDLDYTMATVRRQLTDACWLAEITIPDEYIPVTPPGGDLPIISITVPDHTNTDQTIFYGVIANIRYTQTPTGISTILICYDYAYYLVAQYTSLQSTMYTASGSSYTPDQIIRYMLTGASTGTTGYDTTTKIYPYNLDTVAGWTSGSTDNPKTWTWTPQTKKWNVICDVAEYVDYFFYTYWKYNDPLTNEWCPVAYFVDATDIDSGDPCDFPAKVTCTASNDPYIAGSITTVNQDNYKVNTVRVYGNVDENGETLIGSSTSASVGVTILPIEHIEEDDSYCTQNAVDNAAAAWLEYLSTPGDVYTATFLKRSDLRLGQLLSMSGYDQIPSEDMRITGITYTITPGSVSVNAVFTTDRKLAAQRKLRKVVRPTLWTEITATVENYIKQIEMGKLVDVITANASEGKYWCKDENGNYFEARGPSSGS